MIAVRNSYLFLALVIAALPQCCLNATGLDSTASAQPDAAPVSGQRPLMHQAYVWQRSWNSSVRDAIHLYGSQFDRLVALKAEVSWKSGQPQLVRVLIDYETLRTAHTSVGFALRIGPYPGPFSSDDSASRFLSELAAASIAEAKANQLALTELQIDFDCAESKLDGYRIWVEALRQKISPLPLVITALPAWLNQPAFKRLIAAVDGYVLQVHSLERPKSPDAPFKICDPAAAQRAVERAAQLGSPFRVALPTYGYVIAYDRQGHFIGLSAEGPRKSWPEDAQLREVQTNPKEVAELVQGWSTNRPAALKAIIWYRLPISEDTLNLRWPTLAAMMAGRSPRESLRVETRRVESGLVEVSLENNGELDLSSRLAIEVRWSREGGMRLVAGDGLRGFELVEGGPATVQLQTKSQPCRLPAGEKQVIGWLRFNEDREAQFETKVVK